MNVGKSVTLVLTLTLACLFVACSPQRDLVVPPPSPAVPASEKGEDKKSHKDLFILLPESDGKVGKIEVKADGSAQVIDKPWFGVEVEDSGKGPLTPIPMKENEVQDLFRGALEVHPDLPNRFLSFSLWFESDTTKLKPESHKVLKEIVKTIKNRKSAMICITGHTDREGSEAHNLKLSSKRAYFVRNYLISKGIPPGAFVISYHGEAMPLVYTEDGVAEPQNRRVEVFIK